MVKISNIQIGDTLIFRNGEQSPLLSKDTCDKGETYMLHFQSGRLKLYATYTKNGIMIGGKTNKNDIVDYISKDNRYEVDLHNIKDGDVIYFEDGNEHIIDTVTFDEDGVILNIYDYGTYKFFYNGKNYYEHEGKHNIVQVIMSTQEENKDNVNHPSHYTSGGIECIEAIKASMSKDEYKGYLKGNVLKYVWRYKNKNNPVEDLKKAKVYLEWLIKEVEE